MRCLHGVDCGCVEWFGGWKRGDIGCWCGNFEVGVDEDVSSFAARHFCDLGLKVVFEIRKRAFGWKILSMSSIEI